MHILAFQLRGPRSNDTPAAVSTPDAHIMVSYWGFLEKWFILGLKQEVYKLCLISCSATRKGRAQLKKKKQRSNNWVYQRDKEIN